MRGFITRSGGRRTTAAQAARAGVLRAAGDGQEIGQDGVAVLAGDALRVELHAEDRQRAVAQAHDQPVLGPGGRHQRVGQRVPLDDQAVVARRVERRGQAGEDIRCRDAGWR